MNGSMDGWFRVVCCCAEPTDQAGAGRHGNGEWKELPHFSSQPQKSSAALLPFPYPAKGVAGEIQAGSPGHQTQYPDQNGQTGGLGSAPSSQDRQLASAVPGQINGHRGHDANTDDGRANGSAEVDARQNMEMNADSQQDDSADAAGKLPQPILQKEKSDREKSASLTAGHQFNVFVTRTAEQRSLGIDINHADGESLVVEMVHSGLIQDWNKKHKDSGFESVVLVGDRIVQVNGERGDAEQLIRKIRQNHEFDFLVERGSSDRGSRHLQPDSGFENDD